MPVAVSLDSRPGVNGIVVKVYAGDARHAKPQPIRTGTVEVLMFDGLVRESFERTNQCRHVWSFPAADLRAQLFTTTIGAGYSLQLGWGKDSPRQDKITVVARYLPPQGPPVYSAPSYIALPPPPTPSPPNTAAQTRRRPLPFTWLLYAAWRLHS